MSSSGRVSSLPPGALDSEQKPLLLQLRPEQPTARLASFGRRAAVRRIITIGRAEPAPVVVLSKRCTAVRANHRRKAVGRCVISPIHASLRPFPVLAQKSPGAERNRLDGRNEARKASRSILVWRRLLLWRPAR